MVLCRVRIVKLPNRDMSSAYLAKINVSDRSGYLPKTEPEGLRLLKRNNSTYVAVSLLEKRRREIMFSSPHEVYLPVTWCRMKHHVDTGRVCTRK